MRNPMELTGRTVIVTGTGQGIGRAISELVLDLGGNLVMVERNPQTFADVSAALGGDRTLAVQGDVSDEVFGADGNAVLLISSEGTEAWPRQSKTAVARALAARIADHFKDPA